MEELTEHPLTTLVAMEDRTERDEQILHHIDDVSSILRKIYL